MEDSGTVKKKSAPEELIIIVYGRCVGRGDYNTYTPFERLGGVSNQQVDTMDFPIKAVMSDTACWLIGLPLD